MENYNVVNVQVSLKKDELDKYEIADLTDYVKTVVIPMIHDKLTTLPKGWEVGVRCDNRGCSVGGRVNGGNL
jgi:hypothetical protein